MTKNKIILPYIHAERRRMPLNADIVTKDYVKDVGVFADRDSLCHVCKEYQEIVKKLNEMGPNTDKIA